MTAIPADNMEVGSEIQLLKKVARQNAPRDRVFLPDSIHQADHARSQGFRGPLVSGLVLSGYMAEMLVNFFGPEWLCGGELSETFIPPAVQEGDELTCRGAITRKETTAHGTRVELSVWIEKEHGVRVVVGKASGVFRTPS